MPFDVGFGELIVIGILALIVIGPKDLPNVFRSVGRFTGRMRAMADDFRRTMESAADETGYKDISKDFKEISQYATDQSGVNDINSSLRNMGQEENFHDPLIEEMDADLAEAEEHDKAEAKKKAEALRAKKEAVKADAKAKSLKKQAQEAEQEAKAKKAALKPKTPKTAAKKTAKKPSATAKNKSKS